MRFERRRVDAASMLKVNVEPEGRPPRSPVMPWRHCSLADELPIRVVGLTEVELFALAALVELEVPVGSALPDGESLALALAPGLILKARDLRPAWHLFALELIRLGGQPR